MSDLLTSLRFFLRELKRRRVYRVAAVYAAASFVLWQVADIAVQAVLPEWVLTLVVVLSVVVFPVVLALAWAFDVTPAGVTRTAPAGEEPFEPATVRRVPGWRFTLGMLVLVAGVPAVAWAIMRVYGSETERAVVPTIRSLAVLPLDNLSGDPDQAYFTAGMHDALTAELGRIGALRVISRTSTMHYENTDKRLPQIARELGVDALVEGSVLQAGDQVRITVQLVHGRTDRHVWGQSFERSLRNVLVLQSEVARAIAEQLQVRLAPEEEARIASRRDVNPEAHRLWLKANYQLTRLNPDAFELALESYEEALAIAPDFAGAHAGIAMAYLMLGSWHSNMPPSEFLTRVEEAAERALALDSTLAEAHIALAWYRQIEWDWAGADRAYRRGIELDPGVTLARVQYQNFLTSMGRFEQSVAVGRRTLELDPLSPAVYNELAFAHQLAGNEQEALQLYREGLKLDPTFGQSHFLLALYFAWRGERAQVFAHMAELPAGVGVPRDLGFEGYLYAMTGRTDEARDMLARLTALRDSGYVPATAIADIHMGLGEREEALSWLERAYEERDPSLVWLEELPTYEPLHSEPRLRELIRRMQRAGRSSIR